MVAGQGVEGLQPIAPEFPHIVHDSLNPASVWPPPDLADPAGRPFYAGDEAHGPALARMVDSLSQADLRRPTAACT